MRVVLINANLRDDIFIAPPIGLCYVAAAADAAGHDVTVLDPCVGRPRLKRLAHAVRDASPEVIGVSIRNIDNANMLFPVSYVPGVTSLIRRLREASRAPIVIGGSATSLCPEAILRATAADFAVVSNGERAFLQLLNGLGGGRSVAAVPGLAQINADGRFDLTPPVAEPFTEPRPHIGRWVDAAAYSRRGGGYPIQTKRGCPHACIYCTYSQVLEGHAVRLRAPEEVVEEIADAVVRYRPAFFEFVDSVFNEPREHCTEILERIVRSPWKAQFTAMGIDARNLDRDLLDLMWRAGFRSFQTSPESGSEKMIRRYGKNIARDDLVQAARALRGTGFSVMWYFLVGGPGETNETLQESLNFVFEHLRPGTRPPYNIATFMLGVRMYLGTALWRYAVERRRLAADANPLLPQWYLSEELDVPRAVRQLLDAASRADEILLGLDERRLAWSRLWTGIGARLPVLKPYWRNAWSHRRLLRWMRLGAHPDPDSIARALQRQSQ